MFKRWLPKTGAFFEFFEQHSHLSKEACAELHALATNPDGLESRVKRIKEMEHRADEIAHLCIDTLHNTFITPIDRSDIHRLIRRLDDIIDAVDSVAARMLMYRMTEIRPEMRDLTQTLVEAVDEIAQAIEDLPFLNKRADSIQESCWEVYEADLGWGAHPVVIVSHPARAARKPFVCCRAPGRSFSRGVTATPARRLSMTAPCN